MDCSLIDPFEVKLIVSDVDGTLLDSYHNLHPRTEAAILKVRKAHNIPFVIATGKAFFATTHIRKALELSDCPAIHSNGCLRYNEREEVVKEHNLRPSVVLDIVNLARASQPPITTYLYVRDDIVEVVVDPAGRHGRAWNDILSGFGERVEIAPPGFLERVERGEVGVQKILLFLDESYVPDLRVKLDNWADEFHLTAALSYSVEILPLTASKSLALADLLPMHNITADNVLAFGDGENDSSMLRMAKYGVAMANGMQIAKDSATYRTTSNDEGGVGAALETIFKL
ncbi:hypothetical protein PhCBS80983_g02690 [Powellomyces hirtus]|uniref:Cof-like hydrolase n=1 Tax=Powellomyces hirtus TaxID=109895 RepID=A0A507E6W9_9FUNG|nr:hypothetical protein PhCBS80983_g02690 [Powellomyces hirtus]